MSQLTPSLAAEIVASCRANAAEAAAALSRALDGAFTLTVGDHGSYAERGATAGLEGPGLAVVIKVGGQGLAILLPESTGLLPPWYQSPDPTGASKLSTLAQELSLLALPDSLLAEEFAAGPVENLAAVLVRAGASSDAAAADIELSAGTVSGRLTLVWPLAAPDALIASAAPAGRAADNDIDYMVGSPVPSTRAREFSHLPSYSRSLLKINVPVSVHLAAKKECVQEIVELVPGSIIKFEKGCDELLHMVIGGQTVAEGEAVKIGDKFGFRVTAMVMPQEHFTAVRRGRAG